MNLPFNVDEVSRVLIRASLQGSMALLAVGVICLLAPKLPPRWKSWMCRLAWLRVAYALCTSATLDLPLIAKPAPPNLVAHVQVESVSVATPDAANADATPVALAPVAPAPVAKRLSFSQILIPLWVFGIVVLVAWRLREFKAARALRKNVESPAPALFDILRQVCADLHVRQPALALSDVVATPLLVGILRPIVILPRPFLNSPEDQITFALRHELAHLKRQDLAWIYFVTAIQTALWFNPVVWWAAREFRLVQEIACDEIALRGADNAASFAELLVDFAQRKSAATGSGFAVGIIETKSTLRRRLNAMKALQTGKKVNAWAVGLTLAAMVAVIAPVTIVAEKEQINSAPPEAKPQNSTRHQTEERVRIENLEKLKLELAEQRLNFTDEHPTVIATKRKIASLEKELAAPTTSPDGPPPAGTAAAMSYYMQNPELLKRYFPQLYASMMQNQNNATASVTAANTNSAPKLSDREAREMRVRKAMKESQRVTLRPRALGVVAQVLVKRGDHVKAGWELVRLDNEEADIRLRTAKAELNIAESEHGLKHVTCEQQIAEVQGKKDMTPLAQAAELQKLKLQLVRADAELDLARAKFDATRLELGGYVIKAPADGVIEQVPSVGQTITADGGGVSFFADPAE